MHRRKFKKDGEIINTLENYPETVRQIALETDVALIDLNKMSQKFYEALDPEESKKAFFHFPKGTYPGQTEELKDNTNFSTYGAYQLAKCIIEEIRISNLELRKYWEIQSPQSQIPLINFICLKVQLWILRNLTGINVSNY